MRRTVFIILAVGCFLSPVVALSQPSGGTGNLGGSARAGAPTIEDDIDFVRREIETARDDKTISDHKAHHAERKLKSIEKKLEHLSKDVSEIRHSLP